MTHSAAALDERAATGWIQDVVRACVSLVVVLAAYEAKDFGVRALRACYRATFSSHAGHL
jgi:hypothetical protein